MQPLFSVIIPVYNGREHVDTALDSVLQQTYKNYEIILVNDGSPDDSGKIIEQYIINNPEAKIIYVKQKNKGLGGARNTAINNARGEILAFLDQDDIWYPEKLAKILEVFNADKSIMLVCHNEDIYQGKQFIRTNHYGPVCKEMFKRLLFFGNCLSPSAVSVRRGVVDKIGSFSENLAEHHFIEDYDYWLRIAKAGLKFVFIDESLGKSMIHNQQYSAKNALIMLKREIWLINNYYHKLADKNMFDWIKITGRKARLMLGYLRRKILKKMIKYQ